MTITNNTGADLAVNPDLISVTIDGVEVRVPKGTLVIRAAEQLGLEIPRFCDHPLLEPVAACRACLIEIDGMPKPQPACAQVMSDGMVVRTQFTSDVAREAQEGVMEFLLLNHPLDCPVCDKGGECPLQNQAMSVGRPESRFEETKRTFDKPINVSAQVLLDRERCVSCARCTRFADEIAGDPMIELLERGAKQQVGTASDVPFDSYYSGNTVQICPVGALTSASYRFISRPFDLVSVPTTCEHCASGCSLRTDHRREAVTRRLAWEDPEVNEAWNCDKGRFAFAYLNEGRITSPLVRENGELRVASWPEAIAVAAEGLAAARGRAAVLTGGRLTTEDAYAYGRFARVVLGTDDIDFRARQNSPEEAAFLSAAVAGMPMRVTYESLESASAVLLVAIEPEDESPIIMLRLRKAARGGTKVFSVGAVTTSGLRKMRGSLIPAVPGTEALVVDHLADDIRSQLAGGVILVGERAAATPGLLTSVQRLAQSSGASLAWVPRRAGERGALDAGALAGLLPGGRPITDPAARAEVARAWGTDDIPSAVGHCGDDLLAVAGSGGYGALLIAGVDPDDYVDAQRVHDAINATTFVVSLENHHSAVTQAADVVLPVGVVTEKAGTFLTWEGRPRPFAQVFKNPLAMTDARVLAMISDALDVYAPSDVAGLRREMGQLGSWQGERISAPSVSATAPASTGIALATWRQLLDSGAMQEGEPHLAATARPTVARMSERTAANAGVTDTVVVHGPAGSVQLPVEIGDVLDDVVWVPLNSPGCHVYAQLGLEAGACVTITRGGSA